MIFDRWRSRLQPLNGSRFHSPCQKRSARSRYTFLSYVFWGLNSSVSVGNGHPPYYVGVYIPIIRILGFPVKGKMTIAHIATFDSCCQALDAVAAEEPAAPAAVAAPAPAAAVPVAAPAPVTEGKDGMDGWMDGWVGWMGSPKWRFGRDCPYFSFSILVILRWKTAVPLPFENFNGGAAVFFLGGASTKRYFEENQKGKIFELTLSHKGVKFLL